MHGWINVPFPKLSQSPLSVTDVTDVQLITMAKR
jgi:hypothetical protein